SPILQTFSTDRALADTFYVEVVMTVADAVTGADALDWSAEARKQAILADRLVISKTDVGGAAAGEALAARLRTFNPRAEIDVAVSGAIDPQRLVKPVTARRNAFVAEAEHSDGIGSFVLEFERPLAWPVFARTMDTLIALRGPDLLRVKGLLAVEGCKGPVVVQFVQHLAQQPTELEAWPDDDRHGRVVFITRGVGKQQVSDLLASVQALAT
ncbi:MAG TPA: GTP-binding protein, partial [Pseudolabrys sp.]|nr:GTP-binding protein [Pseudolabrys sp.]